MAWRKKEPRSVHREKIASAASVLFVDKSISTTSTDDIAKAAGYSKAALYVYFENYDYLPEDKETYQIGEEINEKIKEFLISGIDKGDLHGNLKIMPTIFNFADMLSGLIPFTANKEDYINKAMRLSKIQFFQWLLQDRHTLCGYQRMA